MTPREIDAELEFAGRELQALQGRLLGLEARIPATSAEQSEDDLEELSGLPDVRSTLRCIVEDSVAPAIDSLSRVRARVAPGHPE